MVDTSKCFSMVRGRVMRVTRLDVCGARVGGPDSTVVSEGFITVGLTPNFDEGTSISVTNAAGNVCILDEPAPKFTGYSVEINLCGVNPDLVRLITGNPMVFDSQATPQGVGFRVNSGTDLNAVGFALEVWSNVPSAVCDATGSSSYGYFLLPFVKGGNIGDISIGNDAVNLTVSNAKSKDGSGWGVGPYNVVRDASLAAVPLKTAIGTKDHLHLEVTSVAPPTDLCGAQALGVPATTFTAGIPATPTPTNGYAAANLAGMTGVLASPTTNWTTGQYVALRDGTRARWNGTAWAVAP